MQNNSENRSFLSMHAAEKEADESNESPEESSEEPLSKKFPASAEFLRLCPFDIYVFSGDIRPGLERDFSKIIASGKSSGTAMLWLTSFGGSPDAAYLIARSFQRAYDRFIIFINSFCKSSATLICLGADELVMDQNGHLGPLDIQILNREEFGERHSGLNPMEALNSIGSQATQFLKDQFLDVRFGGGLSTRQALEVSTNLAGQLFSPITAQLDFMKYGEFTRSMRIGIEYGNRLSLARNKGGNLKPDAVQQLAMNYPSHGFVIDREEARDRLFNCVEKAPPGLVALAEELQGIVDKATFSAESPPLLIDLRASLEVAVPDEGDDSVFCTPPEAALRGASENTDLIQEEEGEQP